MAKIGRNPPKNWGFWPVRIIVRIARQLLYRCTVINQLTYQHPIVPDFRSGKKRENLRFEFWPIFAPKKHSAKGEGSCGVPTHRTQATRHCAAHLSSATHIAISARDTRCDEAHTGVVISALLSRWYESGIFTAPARVLGTAFVDERPKHVSVKSIALRQSGRVKSRVNSDSRGLIFLYNRRAVCSRPKGVAARSFLVGSLLSRLVTR